MRVSLDEQHELSVGLPNDSYAHWSCREGPRRIRTGHAGTSLGYCADGGQKLGPKRVLELVGARLGLNRRALAYSLDRAVRMLKSKFSIPRFSQLRGGAWRKRVPRRQKAPHRSSTSRVRSLARSDVQEKLGKKHEAGAESEPLMGGALVHVHAD